MKMSSRLLICPTEISGQYRNLAISLQDKFKICEYYTFYSHPFEYGPDIGSSLIPALLRAVHCTGKSKIVLRPLCILVFDLLRFVFFVQSIFRFDIFFFGFSLSILRWNLDLPILRLFGKRVVVNLSHGSDMTPPYLDGAFLSHDLRMPSPHKLLRMTRNKSRTIRFLEYFASDIIGSPLSSSYLANRPFINVLHLGRLTQAHFNPPTVPFNDNLSHNHDKHYRIVHFPSHAPGKGSKAIRETVDQLISDGLDIEFIELRNVPNSVVLEHLATADLLIDQLYSDLPLSALSAEALVLGVPAIICGYEITHLSQLFPDIPLPPVITSLPHDLYATLHYYLSHPDLLTINSKQCNSFMSNFWSIDRVSGNFSSVLYGSFSPYWYYDPADSPFVCGYGFEKKVLVKHLQNYISLLGIPGLCLQNNPTKQQLLINTHNLLS